MHSQAIPFQAAQNTLWAGEKLYPGKMNHRTVAVEITGEIKLDAFKETVRQIMARHEVLRANIVEGNPACLAINPSLDPQNKDIVPFTLIDASQTMSSSSLEEKQLTPGIEDLYNTLKKLNQEKLIDGPFSLLNGPLWRCLLIKFAENKFQFVMLFNHIIVDEQSIGIIMKDFSAIYNAIIKGESSHLESIPPLSLMNFIVDEAEQQRRIAYWRTKLKDLNTLNLQTDFLPQESFQFSGKRLRFTLSSNLVNKLESHPDMKGFTLNQILLASFYALLSRYSGETDICIGITSANRRHKNVKEKVMEKLVNCFFNSIPIRLTLEKDKPFTELLRQVKTSITGALKNQLPIDVVFQEALTADVKAKLQTASPFDVMFVLNKKKPTLTLANTTTTTTKEADLLHSKFINYGINLDEQEEGSYRGFLEFNTDLFKEETMLRLIGHLQKIVEYIAENPQEKIADIPLLLDEEIKLLDEFNQISTTKAFEGTVADFFHEQAKAYPDDMFIVFHPKNDNPESYLTERANYRIVDEFTTKLANHLVNLGVTPGQPIGISVTRSINLIIAILAVLKAGGTVVTLETESCDALSHKMKSANISLVITDHATTPLFSNNTVNITNQETVAVINQAGAQYKPRILNPEQLAYIMYTSGTSGPEPKGVMLMHKGFTNLLNALNAENLPPKSKVICTALPTFDAFLYDLLVALVTHGEIHLPYEDGRYIPAVIESIIGRENINYGVFLPSLLDQLNTYPDHTITMGAVPNEEKLKKLTANPNAGVIVENGIGHTETGICLSKHKYIPGAKPNLNGKPIRNMRTYILDPQTLSRCPIGVPGELFVAGPGVAKGYLNHPELTKEKFITVVYDKEHQVFKRCPPGETNPDSIILYATGDRVCYQLLDKNTVSAEFLGRMDSQIKMNGVRIDPGVIGSVLRNHPLVKDIVVLSNGDNTFLTAYVVPKKEGLTYETLYTEFNDYLAKKTLIPPMAYPKAFCVLSELPITKNGKIDTHSLRSTPNLLPSPSLIPLTEMQSTLQKIWANVLHKPKEVIDINKSFRDLGGHSLLFAALNVELEKQFPELQGGYIASVSKQMTIVSLEAAILLDSKKPEKPPEMITPDVYKTDNSSVIFKKEKNKKKEPSHANVATVNDNPSSSQLSAIKPRRFNQ